MGRKAMARKAEIIFTATQREWAALSDTIMPAAIAGDPAPAVLYRLDADADAATPWEKPCGHIWACDDVSRTVTATATEGEWAASMEWIKWAADEQRRQGFHPSDVDALAMFATIIWWDGAPPTRVTVR